MSLIDVQAKDDELGELTEQFCREVRDGRSPSVEEYAARYPEHAADIRELFPAFELLERSGKGYVERLEIDDLTANLHQLVEISHELGEGELTPEIIERLAQRGETFNRYELKGEIARGGQGAVLRVWDEDLHRDLAMKVVLGKGEKKRETPHVDSKTIGRFLDEAQVTGQLDHPGIVPVHELGIDDHGRVYFTMKLVKGRDLKTIFGLVQEGKELDAQGQGPASEGWTQTRALNVLLKVCEAMAYAHAKDVIHRDLKPANVMVGKYGEVYVMDWGLARVLGEEDRKDIRIQPQGSVDIHSARHHGSDVDSSLITMDGDVVGTPAYMAPEQARGELEAIGPHSDVYAVGAMLYHLLSGQSPYVPDGVRMSNRAVWLLLQKGPPEPLRELAHDVPAELVAICEKAMAREVDERYRDTSELARDLSAYLEQRVVSAYQTGAVAELRKWIVRNKKLASALAATVLVVVGWLATGVVLGKVAEDRLEGLVRLSALQDHQELVTRADDLWPARPHNIEAYRAWIDEARVLVSDLPRHRARYAELQALALPRTEEERRAQRKRHPDYAELAQLAGEIECKRRALAQRRDGVELELPALDASLERVGAELLNAKARVLVEPDRSTFGEEPMGLALALRAQELAPENPDVLDTVAWAYFALGRDEDARTAGFEAFELTAEDRKPKRGESLEKLEGMVDVASSEEELQRVEDELLALQERLRVLDERVDVRSDWHFPPAERGESRWWNNQLGKLIAGVEGLESGLLADGAASPPHGWSMLRRLTYAERLRDGYTDDGEYVTAWERALPAIGKAYGGLALAPQLGLVPIGTDPDSGLWEFAHLASGAIPERDEAGRLVPTEEMGLVFVLLPGGKFLMGAQTTDPYGSNYYAQAPDNEGPVHEVALVPFFLSKYELTQGQWLRLTGVNPSLYHPDSTQAGPIDLRHPVEMVSWVECADALERFALLIPTEAQWEYAARAGTSTIWSTGDQRDSLLDYVNLADQTAARIEGIHWSSLREWPELEDGYPVHAPVGSYLPNRFGLHDVHGNIVEWSRDRYGPYGSPVRAGDGERRVEGRYCVYRGGGFASAFYHARSAFRPGDTPDSRSHELGVRPSKAIAD